MRTSYVLNMFIINMNIDINMNMFIILFIHHGHLGPGVIKKFMLKSAEHKIFPAHKCLNANN